MSQVWGIFALELGNIWVNFNPCCISGPAQFPVANFREGDISTEAETKRQRRQRSARITCHLVP